MSAVRRPYPVEGRTHRARPGAPHFLVDPSPDRSRGQPPGIAHVGGRAEASRLLKGIRKGILDHLSAHGDEPTIVHRSVAERAAWLELTIAYVQNSVLVFAFTQLKSDYTR